MFFITTEVQGSEANSRMRKGPIYESKRQECRGIYKKVIPHALLCTCLITPRFSFNFNSVTYNWTESLPVVVIYLVSTPNYSIPKR
jgi:hypothetical protein